MGNALYPTLPGLTFGVTRTPVFSTTTKPAVSGREFRMANYAYPKYKYKLTYEFLRETGTNTEFSTLVGFFNARLGSFDSFLFNDPDDNTVTAQVIGMGDASNKAFQLVRTFGGFLEPVYDSNSAPAIYLNGVLKALTTDYTISATGVVTFITAPGAGALVTWTGTFYRRVRFLTDTAEFSKFMQQLWELKTIEFISTKP